MFENKHDGKNNLCGEKIRVLRFKNPSKLIKYPHGIDE